jgi:hypothetical protein
MAMLETILFLMLRHLAHLQDKLLPMVAVRVFLAEVVLLEAQVALVVQVENRKQEALV